MHANLPVRVADDLPQLTNHDYINLLNGDRSMMSFPAVQYADLDLPMPENEHQENNFDNRNKSRKENSVPGCAAYMNIPNQSAGKHAYVNFPAVLETNTPAYINTPVGAMPSELSNWDLPPKRPPKRRSSDASNWRRRTFHGPSVDNTGSLNFRSSAAGSKRASMFAIVDGNGARPSASTPLYRSDATYSQAASALNNNLSYAAIDFNRSEGLRVPRLNPFEEDARKTRHSCSDDTVTMYYC